MRTWPPAPERFASRITEVPAPNGFDLPCWQWDVLRPASGYGDFYDGGAWLVHRWSYDHHIGPIPSGLQIDHLCRNRGCVNPWHLEPVTNRENGLRGVSPAAMAARQTHCVNGHEFSAENTILANQGRRRRCRACIRGWNQKYRSSEAS